ncbi:hypothetical protein A3D77_05340 [Candidatus Gottesmanbacteria bacterium RIFCSPHIGHO2_02_FULL_39_11]|uniref:BioF2-like acetyltransferase domain-containing protein n=1 Tax=Candidatus Gottesmanbacteria bacterium RIFCSPHIGHO2_02_FULL_39_11 TaxID=1798382 RepID=A0A1F5ZL96_9BACT|nr:MAG: hypothetical protein A3D77_05340 [Candidatus Gottesmanbacteria bacterium RIFCSPHIGHO2_02_FULL_39_11]
MRNFIPHPMQSIEWENALNKLGMETVRIYEKSTGSSAISYLIHFREIPFTNLKIGYLSRSLWPGEESLNNIYTEAKKRECIFIKIEPEEITGSESLKTVPKNYLVPGKKFLYEWTIDLDLAKSSELLFSNLKPATRRNIKIAQKNGIYIREMTSLKGFEILYKLYRETILKKGFSGYDYNYLKTLFLAMTEKIAYIFIAYYNNIPLAAYEIFLWNKKLYYPLGGTSKYFSSSRASYLLMWEVIQFGKKMEALYFDMWGCLGPDSFKEGHPWYGLTRFKLGFGGSLRHYPNSFDLVINPEIYYKYDFINVFINQLKESGILISDRKYNLV